MKPTRRTFLAALAALPFAGRFIAPAQAETVSAADTVVAPVMVRIDADPIYEILSAVNAGPIRDGDTISLTGAMPGDRPMLVVRGGGVYSAYVSAPDVVTIRTSETIHGPIRVTVVK